MSNHDDQKAPMYGYVDPATSAVEQKAEEEFTWSDFFLEKFWILTPIASLAISLFNAKQLDGFPMFLGFLLGTFLGLVALPTILAALLGLIPALIIRSARADRSFKKAFKPVFTAFLFLFWLILVLGWSLQLIALRSRF
jgi:hypothetical protein